MNLIVINCWIYGSDQFQDMPDCILGPYTDLDTANTAAGVLTCTHQVTVLCLRLDPPEWAVS